MRAQAAVEFLVTYGWALMAVVIIVSLIFALGIFNPDSFRQDECYVGPSLPCMAEAFTQATQTKVNIKLTNAYPFNIKIGSGELVIKGNTYSLSFNNPNQVIKPGQSVIGSATINTLLKRVDGDVHLIVKVCKENTETCTDTLNTEVKGKLFLKVGKSSS